MADIDRLKEMATDHGRYRTHYDGCVDSHLECVALAAADEIERLRSGWMKPTVNPEYQPCRKASAVKKKYLIVGLLLALGFVGCGSADTVADVSPSDSVVDSTVPVNSIPSETTVVVDETSTTSVVVRPQLDGVDDALITMLIETACSVYAQGGAFSEVVPFIMNASVTYLNKLTLVKVIEIGTQQSCPTLSS